MRRINSGLVVEECGSCETGVIGVVALNAGHGEGNELREDAEGGDELQNEEKEI